MSRKSQCCPKFPTPPHVGTISICKTVLNQGLEDDDFEFTVTPSVTGELVVVPGALSPASNCVDVPGQFAAGSHVTIEETLPGPSGSVCTAISVLPVAALVSTDIPTGTVVVEIQDGVNVQVTFTNDLQD